MIDRIVTHPANDAYRTGYDVVFGKSAIRESFVKEVERVVLFGATRSKQIPVGFLSAQSCLQDAHSEPTRYDQLIDEQIQAGGGSKV